MKINIRFLNGDVKEIEFTNTELSKVSDLKDHIAYELGFERTTLKICFRGQALHDDALLSGAKVEDGCFIVVFGEKVLNTKAESKISVPLGDDVCENNADPSIAKKRKLSLNAEDKIRPLIEIGFSREKSLAALELCDGDISNAAEYLLDSNNSGISPNDDDSNHVEEAEGNDIEVIEEVLDGALDFIRALSSIERFEEARQHVIERKISPKDFAASISSMHPHVKDLINEHWDVWEMIVQEGLPNPDDIIVNAFDSEEND